MENCSGFIILFLIFIVVGLNFQFIASHCVISTRSLTEDRQPLILLASTREWFPLTFSENSTIHVPNKVSLALVCPNSIYSNNSFEYFSGQNEILAKCVGGDIFGVQNGNFTFKDLQCQGFLKPTLHITDQTCLAPKTFSNASLEPNWVKIQVGYPTNEGFIPVYGVCFDKMNLRTLYSVSKIYPEIGRNEFPVKKTDWVSDDELYGHIKFEEEYDCSRQKQTFYTILNDNNYEDKYGCCFLKSKLVNDADLIYRPQQIATYHYVNTVPQCHKENWKKVNELVRRLSSTLERPLVIWTGVYMNIQRVPQAGYPQKDLYLYYKTDLDKAQPVPLLSWKIIYDGHTEKALAVVTVNDSKRAHSTLEGLIRCQDICGDLPWINFEYRKNIDYGYTYCCELEDFLKAFDFTKNNFPKASGGLLDDN